MKILLYGINYAPESVGIGKYSSELTDWLSSNNHQVRVLTAHPYFPQWRIDANTRNIYKKEDRKGIKIQRCPLWVPRKPSGLTRLIHLLSFALTSFPLLLAQRRWKPDLIFVVAPAFFCAPGALLLSGLIGSRCISWLHIQDFELDAAFELGLLKGKLLRSLAQRWESWTLQRFNICSSISHAMIKRLIEKQVNPSSVRLLPNWVDLQDIQPLTAEQRENNRYRRELKISKDQIVLMYSGSMNKKQGLELLADVIRSTSDLDHLVWILAGEGPTKSDLMVATRGLANIYHLPLQPSKNLQEWLGAADIHLLPQKAGAADLVLPSKLLGMLASGRPVIASSPPESELAQITDQAGISVTPENPLGFARAVRTLVADKDLRQRAGHQARKLAQQHFDRDLVLKDFESTLQQLGKEIGKRS